VKETVNESQIVTDSAQFSPQAVLRAVLATDFSSFIEYTFGVLRPGIPFRRNWHIDAMAYKLSQVATGEIKRLIITIPPPESEVDLRLGSLARMVSWPSPI
jgi:hypothetical protein